jgi:2,3-bisphosphoglycerate-independent phosphoglycerate mutase
MGKNCLLLILDGFGLGDPDAARNAITAAKTANLDQIFSENPHSRLQASGLAVGLPEGQMGNSEVGHMNIGSGRVVMQDLPKINREIETGSFFKNEIYRTAVKAACRPGHALHILGLLSDGGVHSHIRHIFAMLDMAEKMGVPRVYVHCFLDGRDVAPTSGAGFVAELQEKCRALGNAKIATICGRFYAMDRDRRWDRIEKAYRAMVCGEGRMDPDPVRAVKKSYESGITDEFMVPTVICPEGVINPGDSVVFMNFRPDRAREMTWALNNEDFDGFNRTKKVFPLCYVCTAQYDENLTLPVAYPPEVIKNTLGEYLSGLGYRQLRVAETEKYAHVTFFFNGGIEEAYPGEDRCLVPSPKQFSTYDLIPEMSARPVCDKVLEALRKSDRQFIVCNFANCDMVGHTGVFSAAVKAVETVDECLGRIYHELKKHPEWALLLTADHGNVDIMVNADGSINTAHTTNPVPFLISGAGSLNLRQEGKLADIAPTVLTLMGIPKPKEMTGISMIQD